MLVSVVLVRLMVVALTVRVSLPLLPITEPPETRSAASTVNVVAELVPAAIFSMLVRVVLVRLSAVPPAATVSLPVLPRMLPLAARSPWLTVIVVAADVPAFRISMLLASVLDRSNPVPLNTSVSVPLLPRTEPPAARSPASTMKVVARLLLAFRISTLVRVVPLTSKLVPVTIRVSVPNVLPLPTTLPFAARSA